MLNDILKKENLKWVPALNEKISHLNNFLENIDLTKPTFSSRKQKNVEMFGKKNTWKLPVQQLQIRVVAPRQIRALCLRQSSEGFLIGRVWNASTVRYKDLKPIPGGLFCESAFGSLKRGRCVCTRIQWRSYPKLPKKLGRFEITSCPYCLTYRIYPIFYYNSIFVGVSPIENSFFSSSKSTISWLQNIFLSKIEQTLSKVKSFFKFFKEIHLDQKISCKCKRTKIYIYWFFSVVSICKFCITSTGVPFYGLVHYRRVFKSKPNNVWQSNNHFTLVDIVSLDYHPGFCECGRTNTEVVWDKSTFCGYCGVEVSIEILPRRYCLGYFPLSVPVAHFWYYYYEPQPLSRLLGFSRQLFLLLLRCERIVAEEIFLVLKLKNQVYFSTDFQPVEQLSNSHFNARVHFSLRDVSLSILIRGYSRKAFFGLFKTSTKKKNLFYFDILRQCNVVIPKVELCTFPWYCLYRDIFIFSFSKRKEKRRSVENLENVSSLLISSPENEDCSFNLYQILCNIANRHFPENVSFVKNLGIRYQTYWLFREPPRTGGEMILNRLRIFNYKDWCSQAKRCLKVLKKDIEILKGRTILDKGERSKIRLLLRIRNQLLIRFRIITEMQWVCLKPYWLILQCLPILPPDLRPILSLGEGKIIASDINSLYQRVIERNNRVAQRRRLVRFYGRYSTRDLQYHERLLQEALECLFDNSIGGKKRETDSKQRVYKSLAEVLKGKRGRFRNNLLGKRVDYSGRSVIISGPDMNLYQCGLPREISIVLFQPFLVRFLVGQTRNGQKIQTRFQARQYLRQRNHDSIWSQRRHILWGFPVLLNRAPTLHRFGFQAFQLKLVFGRAIHLHPLVCSGFNADFDGDQIAIHVPLSSRSRSEAWRLIVPGSHFFSPATGELTFFPNQDIILGIYYLTTKNFAPSFSSFVIRWINFDIKFIPSKEKTKTFFLFSREEEILQILEKRRLKFHQFIWLCNRKSKFFDYEKELNLLERRIDWKGKEEKYSLWNWTVTKPKIFVSQTTLGRFIFFFSLRQVQRK
jgi:DNA-directed RNA polymerase beta' subunit